MIIKTMTTTVMMSCRMPAMSSITPAAVNLHGPSSTFFGAQHMSMLEAMQASNPPIAPTTPGMPPAKPISEKMELPHRQGFGSVVLTPFLRCACIGQLLVPKVCLFGREAHKTKQEMVKHLALFASLGRSGLSEHILRVPR